MEPGISFAALDPDPEGRFTTLRRLLGVSTFGLNQIALRPGERGRIHVHEHQEEVFLVLEGTLRLLVEIGPEGPVEEYGLETGSLVRVAPGLRRQLVNRGPGRLMLLAMGGAHAHDGRDALAWRDWGDPAPAQPQEIPLPDDLPPGELASPGDEPDA